MRHLVDSDVIIDFLRGRPPIVRLFDSLISDRLAMSVVSYGEIYDGIYHGHDPLRAETVFLTALQRIDVLPLDEHIMRLFGRTRGDLRKIGNKLSDSDLMIAATALHHDLTLVTRNLKHFTRIPALKLHPLPE